MFGGKDKTDWRSAYPGSEQEKSREPQRHGPRRSKLIIIILVVVPLAIFSFLMILLSFQLRMNELKDENSQLRSEAFLAASTRDFYREAYQSTLRDALRLSSIYGGQGQLLGRASVVRDGELELFWSLRGLSEWPGATLWNPQYLEFRIARQDRVCLPLASVRSVVNETLIVVNVTGGTTLDVYVDGYYVAQLQQDGALSALEVPLVPGKHEVSLVSKDATPEEPIMLHEVFLDTTDVTEFAMIDLGAAEEAFDCKDAEQTTTLTSPGAIRVSFEKA
jgi:hypothetical protein